MRYFASIDADGTCTGTQMSESEVIGPNVVEVTNAVNIGIPLDDFMWRKHVGGAWSTDKFPPPAPVPGPDLPAEINQLKAENTQLQQQLAQSNADFTAFTDFYFEKNPTQA